MDPPTQKKKENHHKKKIKTVYVETNTFLSPHL